ncbi:TetR/AcrR family transcriptional regulator [Falsihalocynthiibacter sp. BN13B15]|uniref:TetR/AcrR family transcriptional regulator n=1 Tax=Falsihalocynthiibacter sp. BN13B15 TaxID=3240871 RepID=UPI003510B8BE
MAKTSLQLTPKKIPIQTRSKATVEVILQATAHILESGGLAVLTTNLIAERAGVSVGSVYQYFPSKEAILIELVRRMRQDLCEDLEEARDSIRGLGLREAVEKMVRASAAHHIRAPRRVEVLEYAECELPMTTEIEALKRRSLAAVLFVLNRYDIIDAPTAAFDLSAMCKGVIGAQAQIGCKDFEPVIRRLTDAVCGYLLGAPDESNS